MKNTVQKSLEKIDKFLKFKHKTQSMMNIVKYVLGFILIPGGLYLFLFEETKYAFLFTFSLFICIIINEEIMKFIIKREENKIRTIFSSEEEREQVKKLLERWWQRTERKVNNLTSRETHLFLRKYYFLKNLLQSSL